MARDVLALVAAMTLDEKASLTAGADMWRTSAIERLGIGHVTMTDGPNGARGAQVPGVGDALPSVCVPCGAALGATWDVDLLGRVGDLLGRQTRGKAARILLAPTVNLHRSPLAGRHFESYSEDPLLTGLLAASFVAGVQRNGVATTVKHYLANESEFQRYTADSHIDERTLRELYLLPFELAIRRGGSLGVMTSYNRLNGAHLADDEQLVTGVLRGEWGFVGFVVSDWFAIGDTARAARAGLDLQMPGPSRFYGSTLAAAVRAGSVAEADVDRAAVQLLSVLDGLGALDDPADARAGFDDRVEDRALAREAAAAGMVLLINDATLPLDPEALAGVAVIGPNADRAVIMGGGSAQLRAPYLTTPLAAIRAALAPTTAVSFSPGVDITRSVPPLPADWVTGGNGEPGFAIEVFAGHDLAGTVLRRSSRPDGTLLFDAVPAEVDGAAFSFRAVGTVRVPERGPYTLSLIQLGRARVLLDGVVVLDGITEPPPPGTDTYGLGSEQICVDVALDPELGTELVVEYANVASAFVSGVKVGMRRSLPPDSIAIAAAAAAAADVAIVVVGTDADVESEGRDRTSMRLPGEQDALVAAVAAANPRTVVVVNAAAPVTMPWADSVAAVLVVSFGGQEMSNALADVLVGVSEPGGRLPTSLPSCLEHTPSFGNFPARNGVTEYAEGVLLGYRWYDTRRIPVAFPFGHGLSYTTFRIDPPHLASAFVAGGELPVEVTVTNIGDRPGSEVVQCYVTPPVHQRTFRPIRELKAFVKVHLEPGESATVRLTLDDRSFAYWNVPDPDGDEMRAALARSVPWAAADVGPDRPAGWTVEGGDYQVGVGRSVSDVAHVATVRVVADG